MDVDAADRGIIAVLGCGLMGAGIAEVFARAGHVVRVFDQNPSQAELVASRLDVIRCETIETTVVGAELVIEAVPEVLDLKLDVLARASAADAAAIIASNTSSLAVEPLADAVAGADRFLITHFFNPASLIPLVELVPASATSDEHVDRVAKLLEDAGKRPVRLDRAVPGFIANRLQAALLREAFALEADGIASFAEIDTVVRAGLGSRWATAGAFGVADLGGLDVWNAVCEQLFPLLDTRAASPDALRERVASGRLGAKTGDGLFTRTPDETAAVRARIAAHLALEFPDGEDDAAQITRS